MRRTARQLGQIADFGAVAEVRAVAAEPVHRLAIRKPGERRRDLDPHRAERTPEQTFGDLDHLFRVGERHLHVHLGELRLAIRPQVLVPEAADDLVVAVHPSDHEQLLEELR